MSSYSRMVVIPQEEYVQMSAIQQARQPLTQQFYNAEQDYQKNLHVSDPHRSVMLQSETIERMKGLKDQMRSYLTISTPKPYRSRAEALFQSMEPYLNVNEKGEIIKDDNSVIESSRYEDLIQHAVRDRRRNFIPTGWSYFIELMKKHNVPRSSLNRETLHELDAPMKKKIKNTVRGTNILSSISSLFPETPPRTPSPKRPIRQSRSRSRVRRLPSQRAKTSPSKFMFKHY